MDCDNSNDHQYFDQKNPINENANNELQSEEEGSKSLN